MLKLPVLLMGLVLFIMTISSCTKDSHDPHDSDKFTAFNAEMRVLWSDHVAWTRNVIINIVDGAPGTTEAVNRLLQNQVDIGNAIKPYYGTEGGNGLTVLLGNHILIAADLITSANSGNTTSYNAHFVKWYANADSIAVFLNAANPNHFPLSEWKVMMKEHLDYTLEEVTARIERDYPADVIAYDKVYAEMMMMADMLAEGIALQYPDKF